MPARRYTARRASEYAGDQPSAVHSSDRASEPRTDLRDLLQVLTAVALPVGADSERPAGTLALVGRAEELWRVTVGDGCEASVNRGAADCVVGEGVNSSVGQPAERESCAPMAKASVERSSGAVWKAVSKTPSTGAKRMSQNVRANCRYDERVSHAQHTRK